MMQSTKALETVHIILGPFLIFTRTSHLRFQGSSFLEKVTKWLPMQPEVVVLLSGGAERNSGEGLLFLVNQRNNVGWLNTLFSIAFFPSSIYRIVIQNYTFGLNFNLLRNIKSRFQPQLILLVLWSTATWNTWRKKIKLQNQFHEMLTQ